ncbi:MAG: glycosyltransferase family 2 protein [Candidatus Adiutrix sp.]|jgi:dolichol-phosphate mannosyltransferase|nr:glycosyltransferase family 2 protein [Candidatus Adiutrix sp.]
MLLSVVIPVYGAPTILPVLYERLVAALSPWTDFELIMVNDHCPQGSGNILEELAAKDRRVKFIDFIRNYGQHIAIAAGLDYARGDYAVVMDCDLQDQPEEIKKMYDHLAGGGFEAVFGVRINRQHGTMRRLESKVFNVLYRLLAQNATKTTQNIGNFSIISRKAIDAHRLFRESERLYGAVIGRILPEAGYVEVAHSQRCDGESSYTLIKKFRLAANTIIANSNKPLIFAVYCALGAFALSLLIGLKILVSYLLYGTAVSGWTSLMLALCFFSGLQMLFLGVLGAYMGSASTAVKHRPLYIISKSRNVSGAPEKQ